MVELNEKLERVQGPPNTARSQRRLAVPPHPREHDEHPVPPQFWAHFSIRSITQLPRSVPSIHSLLWFFGGIFLGIAVYKFGRSVAPSACDEGDADGLGVDIASAPDASVTTVPEVAIAVMGATGSGKSTFINLISGSDLGIGNGLRSCTDEVKAVDFNLDGRRVVLIDTPGFDDTTLSDTDVLNMIAAFLANSYERGKTLAGVLYFHRISEPKMTGMSRKNFGMFRKLCGDSALKNVVIVTNMWGEVDLEVGNAREIELATEDIFFKPVLDKAAQMIRHENTVPSAERIIRLILDNHPLPLRIQEELVNEHKTISETSAGEELSRELDAQIEKHQREMQMFKEEMERAMKDKDEETRRELEIEIQTLQMRIEGLHHDSGRMASDYKRQMNELRNTLRFNTVTLKKMRKQADQSSEILDRLRNGYFSKLGAYFDGIDL